MADHKPFLLLQIRPEDEASDNEYEALLAFGKLRAEELHRVRAEKVGVPESDLDDYAGVIVGGGPYNVSDAPHTKDAAQQRLEQGLAGLFSRVIERDVPYLGICYGLGALAMCQGGVVSKEHYGEAVGGVTIELTEEGERDPLLRNLPTNFRALCGHKEACQNVPPGAVLLASSAACPVQMLRVKRNVYATQFHVELDVAGIALRIKIYKHAGYFHPDEAESLIDAVSLERVSVPMQILERFVARYRTPNPA
jgi:GMP synthase (glutamine-hydrolysing)